MIGHRPGARLTLKDFLLICEIGRLQVRGIPVTWRRLRTAMGWHSPAAVEDAVHKLVGLGLAKWEPRLKGATVLTCQVELIPSAWSEAKYREIVGDRPEAHQQPHPAGQAGDDPGLWGQEIG